jgi:L-threonylcarbamoyladenylate synthase
MSLDTAPVFSPHGDDIARAALALQAGQLVGIPTETVYGLGGDATNDQAVAAIFEAKNRPDFNPLIIHFADEDSAWAHVVPCEGAEQLAQAFWPGPLTLVLPRRSESDVSLLASAGLDTLAVRVPAHPTARLLLMTANTPVAAPSANRSGTISPTLAKHVTEAFAGGIAKDFAGVVDGGPCKIGLESTVIGFDSDTPVLLRPGGISNEDIEGVVGALSPPAPDGAIASPGMLKRHYAPATRLRLDATDVQPGEVMLGFGPEMPEGATNASLNLSSGGDVREAAANLFAMLRELDTRGASAIAVMPIPHVELGRAINDRLLRAATSA